MVSIEPKDVEGVIEVITEDAVSLRSAEPRDPDILAQPSRSGYLSQVGIVVGSVTQSSFIPTFAPSTQDLLPRHRGQLSEGVDAFPNFVLSPPTQAEFVTGFHPSEGNPHRRVKATRLRFRVVW